jgi:hypothetical protein
MSVGTKMEPYRGFPSYLRREQDSACKAEVFRYTNPHSMTKRTKIPEAVLEYFRKQGSIGGKKRSESLTAEERSELARKAVQARWAKVKANRKGSEKK